jgi:hypothetical protein
MSRLLDRLLDYATASVIYGAVAGHLLSLVFAFAN